VLTRALPSHRAGIELSTIEVRFNKLSVTADVFTTSSRALPSLPNFFLNAAQVAFASPLLHVDAASVWMKGCALGQPAASCNGNWWISVHAAGTIQDVRPEPWVVRQAQADHS
jgi:hypothetical protein